MPTVNLRRDDLFAAMGSTFSKFRVPSSLRCCALSFAADKEFAELCFSFGIELDDIVRAGSRCLVACVRACVQHCVLCSPQTSERMMWERERGVGTEAAEHLSTDVVYKIDIPANRYACEEACMHVH